MGKYTGEQINEGQVCEYHRIYGQNIFLRFVLHLSIVELSKFLCYCFVVTKVAEQFCVGAVVCE